MKYLKRFESHKKYESNYTHSDMEFVEDLYNDGMTDPEEIAREMDWKDITADDVKQIIEVLKKEKNDE